MLAITDWSISSRAGHDREGHDSSSDWCASLRPRAAGARMQAPDCTKFVASCGWAERAAALGWVVLFGCCRHRPLDRPGVAFCRGPSMAAGWSSFVATGPLLSWRRMGRSAFLTAGAFMQGI